jgi:hypothetical protein
MRTPWKRARSIARSPVAPAARKRLLILCEGQLTEPQYFLSFQRLHSAARVHVEIALRHGDPKYLVDEAKRRGAEARRASAVDASLGFDEVWVVCDVDDHARLPDAKQMARDNGIFMAVSNPCVELWFLLHFADSPGMQHRHDVQRLLDTELDRRGLGRYAKHLRADVLEASYEQARARAERLERDASLVGEDGRNPSTAIHRLTESIRGR